MSNEENIDYQKLNSENIKQYFEDTKIEYEPNTKITDEEFNKNLPKLIKPNININSKTYTSDEEYIEKLSDPYKRLIQLKHKLLENKNNIDEIISKYNDINSHVDISDINNYSLLYSNAINYKNKIDSFLNYDLINKMISQKGLDSDSESSDEDEQKKLEKSKENKLKKEENKKNILKKREENGKILKQLEENSNILFKESENIKSINEKYNILSNNLVSKLNDINSDLNLYMKFKICSNPDLTINILKSKVIEVEKQISKIENIISDYDFNSHKSTIFGALNYYLKISMENNKDWITNRYENVRTFEDMINLFTGEEENMILMTKYKQICEAYMLYLSMKKFGDAIPYLKKRVNAIKSIILNSEQFEFDMKKLTELIKKNEENYEILKSKYLQTLENFSNLECVLKEINNLDAIIKKKNLVIN